MIRLTAVSPPAYRRSRIHEYNGIAAAGLSLCLILFFLSGAAAISPSMVNPLADRFFPSSLSPQVVCGGLSVINRTIANTVVRVHQTPSPLSAKTPPDIITPPSLPSVV